MLPALCKVLERVKIERLQDRLNDSLGDRHYDFRKGSGTVDAWLRVQTHVNESMNRYLLGLFIDFKGAFDY